MSEEHTREKRKQNKNEINCDRPETIGDAGYDRDSGGCPKDA